MSLMGKNKRRQIPYIDSFHKTNVLCDSIEECDMLEWCCEAAQLKLIDDFEYQPQSIPLFESIDYLNVDNKRRVLLRDHVYSPDFKIIFCPRSSTKLCREFKLSIAQAQQDSFQVHLDVKGTFQKADGGRVFSINQKWVYQKTGIYVLKLVPKDFFQTCGCPQACFYTRKANRTRKAFQGYQSIKDAFASDLLDAKSKPSMV